jgi:aspartyl-tRNA(Asn)/glutamyl-tRNA(Gln) amidotransferase subunit C
MSVTVDEVRRIAALARLTVPESREAELVAQLNGILAHMDVLQQLPGLSADPADALAGMPLAADNGPAVALHRAPQSMAPAWRDGFFLVPRLATHEGAGESADDDGEGA